MTRTSEQKIVWVDTDITLGQKRNLFSYCDVEDGFALAALMRSDLIQVAGVSSTLGNTDNIAVSTRTADKVY